MLQRPVVFTGMEAILSNIHLDKRVVMQYRDRPVKSHPAFLQLSPPFRRIADILIKKFVPEILMVQVCYQL